MPFILFLAAFAVLFFYGVMLYNGLVRLKHEVSKSWANIDVLLKQRHEELPKLVDVCRHYSQFEQDTLSRVMEARAMLSEAARAANVGRIGELEGQLRSLTGQIFAVAEAYPELKADAQYSHLALRITQLEDSIADRRELYNEAVNLNNVRIEQFPDVVIASLFSFRPAKPLRFAEAEKRDVDVNALFQR
ncbi:LemA family protein [Vogesella sp. XCS3]|jgi:LemA protein|uniref:LemA family protein n=1 Tax=Vogesella sp. XCS3 TaxID=2877939 RepID=UPI001B68E46D|nr:LemA family protein [Vogesella sp. XCS3]MBP7581788.1 LemA family protein [Vogesella sp.]UDM17095.1 LemA family protein [Vogesella sp. XCS3]